MSRHEYSIDRNVIDDSSDDFAVFIFCVQFFSYGNYIQCWLDDWKKS